MIDPWRVSDTGFPRQGPPSAQFRHLLHYAILAPSGHNTQPWRFRLAGNSVELLADRARRLPIVDPEDRELTISCGAALGQLRLAIRHFGFADVLDLFPDVDQPQLLARVGMGEARSPDADDERLFHAIPLRRSNRSDFAARPVPPQLVKALRASAASEHVAFHEVAGTADRGAVAELVAEGDRRQFADAAFRRELAQWIRPGFSGRRDGIPGAALGMGALASCVAPWIIRSLDVGKPQAMAHRRLALESPLLAVLGTRTDTPAAWLATGQALSRLLLRAHAEGVAASYLNAPIEVPALRSRLRDTLGLEGYPQLLLRLGYGPEVGPTPRRHVSEVLLKQ